MKKKKRRDPSFSLPGVLVLACAVGALTLFRLMVATGGAITGEEALLEVCSAHPAGGYVEGPAGAPLLLFLLNAMGLSGLAVLRWIPSLALLPMTWALWWIGCRIAPHRPSVALWSALLFNLLPPVNAAALVMNGAVLVSLFPLLASVAGWRALLVPSGRLGAWLLFGAALAVATLFDQWSGILLPAAFCACFIRRGWMGIPWKGLAVAGAFLLLGWMPSLAWNLRHDWIQWNGVAAAFDRISILGHGIPLGTVLLTCAAVVPFLVLEAFSRRVLRVALILIGVACAGVSGVILSAPGCLPAGIPSPLGVRGVGELAKAVRELRSGRPDPKGGEPFLIAQTPGLAALLGASLPGSYPERPGAPSVFHAESPCLNSSFSLWPSYVDAVAAAVKDVLYTEEKSASPFLGRNALYITTEPREDLPQTITGAFSAVGLLAEVPVVIAGRNQIIRIYQCESYHSLAL